MTSATRSVRDGLYHGEDDLRRHLLTVGERHRTDHEVAHVTRVLADWSRENLRRLEDLGQRSHRSDRSSASSGNRGPMFREPAGQMLPRRPEPGLLLLHDLRQPYVMASENSCNRTMLGQAAQAARDAGLLRVVGDCHPRTQRQVKWCNATLKATSPQILTAMSDAGLLAVRDRCGAGAVRAGHQSSA